MAERRMFSKSIVTSARFLRMPVSSRELYFHLVLNADDDGVVEAFPVMRMVGAGEDDLKVLVGREFVVTLSEDDLIVYIKHWKEQNTIRADRKVNSRYQSLLLSVVPDLKLTAPKKRSDVKGNDEKEPEIIEISAYSQLAASLDSPWTDNGQSTDSPRTDNGQSMDGQWTADGRHSIGKGSIGKESIDKGKEKKEAKASARLVPPTLQEVKDYIREMNYGLDPEEFYDANLQSGWKLKSGQPVKDWKARVRTFERYRKSHGGYSEGKQTAKQKKEYKGYFDDTIPEGWE